MKTGRSKKREGPKKRSKLRTTLPQPPKGLMGLKKTNKSSKVREAKKGSYTFFFGREGTLKRFRRGREEVRMGNPSQVDTGGISD